jgi:heme O synthase-like polyprenyltransferase
MSNVNFKENPKMAKSITAILVVAVALVAAIALNPSAEKHRTKIKEAVAERSQLESALGVGQITAFASRYHSIGVASYTTVNDKTVSFGAFGMVFVAG